MKASKFIVLVGGILGIIAFFLPMVSLERDGKKASASAFQVIKGLDSVQSELNKDEVKMKAASVEGGSEFRSGADKGIEGIKTFVFIVFAPALLLLAIGGAGAARKKFGRVAGTFSLLLGLVGLAIAALLRSAAEGDGGIAITILLLTGLAGIVGGIMALVKPDRGMAAVGMQATSRAAA